MLAIGTHDYFHPKAVRNTLEASYSWPQSDKESVLLAQRHADQRSTTEDQKQTRTIRDT